MLRSPLITAAMAVVILCLCAATAQSVSRDWTNAAGNNNWFTPTNWNPAGAPAAWDSLAVGFSPQRTPVANASVTTDNFGGITVRNSGSHATFNSDLYIGNEGVGGLRIDVGGAVSSRYTVAGNNSGGRGFIYLEDPGSSWDLLGTLVIGNFGEGTFQIEEQATMTSRGVVLGDRSSGIGDVEMRDSGTSWTSIRHLFVGKNGTGEFEVWEGAQLQTAGGSLGERSGSSGTMRLGHAGTKWRSTDDVWVGGDSSGPGGVGLLDVGVSNTSSTLEVRYTSGILRNLTVWNGTGTLQGGGAILAHVANRGSVKPGNSTGSMSIVGNYQQYSTGELNIEFSASLPGQYDALNVSGSGSGNVTLDGKLNLLPLAAYTDPTGDGNYDLFQIISANNVTGSFSQVLYNGTPLTSLSHGVYGWDDGSGFFRTLTIGSTGVQMVNYDALPGDANGDGDVDGTDFNIWNANNFSMGTDWSTGDFNSDGRTDGTDFNIWNANKFTSAASAGRLVPEPTSWLVALLPCVLMPACRRR